MKNNSCHIEFDRSLIEKCQTNAPRYTSYPTADRFNSTFNSTTQLIQLEKLFGNINKDQLEPISLYIHIPFCNTLCLFCACNKIITNDRKKITIYLAYLERELVLYSNLINKKLDVIQLHFGGGSPSWLSIDELNQVINLIKRFFNLEKAKEIAMEVDPRHTTTEFIQALKDNGFNRISIGVQDFKNTVQKAINRIQPYELTKLVLDSARNLGFKSTNIDLIYGLPLQTLESFSQTIDCIIDLSPDRIALFNYAHLPHVFMSQTRIIDADLPDGKIKLDILQMSVEKLTQNGYVFIGMDHFAKPDDDLAVALNNGSLQRNFQGYSTFADTNMLSFGVSSIGFIGNSYYQNNKTLEDYYQKLDSGKLPIMRGIMLSQDDIIRREIIQRIMCQFSLDYAAIEQIFKLNFTEYFSYELTKINDLQELGLVSISNQALKVTPKGRFLIRNVAMIFDKYLQNSNLEKNLKKSYSKVI